MPNPESTPYTFDKIFRMAITAGIIWGLIWLLGYLGDVLIPFVVALLLAYLLNPLVNGLQKWLQLRLAAIFGALFLVFGAFLLAGMLIAPRISAELRNLGGVITNVTKDARLSERLRTKAGPEVAQIIHEARVHPQVRAFLESDNLVKTLKDVSINIFSFVSPRAMGLMKGTWNFVIGMMGLTVVGLYLVFLLLDYDKVRRGWQDLLPEGWKETVVDFVRDFNMILSRHFRAQGLVAACVGVLFAVGFSLIGLPLAILFGLLVGLLNMVPYLQLLSIPPALILAMLQSVEQDRSLTMACLLVLFVYGVVQLIQDSLLVPRIQGEATGLRPAVILLSLSIWGKLLGFLGLLLALPMTCLVLVYYRRCILGQNKETG